MLTRRDWIFYLFGLLIAALCFVLPLWRFQITLFWHDSQRVGEILILGLAALGLTIYALRPSATFPSLPRKTFFVVLAIAVVGLLSAALSRQPIWALVEWGLFFALMGLAYAIALARRASPQWVDYGILGLICLICAALTSRDLATYAGLIVRGDRALNVHDIFTGFSNPRFFGQFVSLTLPMLAVAVMSKDRLRRYAAPAFVLLALWWLLAIACGTRGTWLGIGTAILIMLWLGSNARRWVVVQALAVIIGLLLYWWLFTVIPKQWSTEVSGHAATRLTTSLSGREVIWQQAIDLMVSNPLLGNGPMHFADVINNNATHPHQSILQWAAEWGLPSAIALLGLITTAAIAVFRRIRAESASQSDTSMLRVGVAAALVASLTQSLVDGVLVMPYTQLWLAIVSGWCLGLHWGKDASPSRDFPATNQFPKGVSLCPPSRLQKGLPIALLWASLGVLGYRVVSDLPHLNTRMVQFVFSGVSGHLQPRFWSQGIIGMDRWQPVKRMPGTPQNPPPKDGS